MFSRGRNLFRLYSFGSAFQRYLCQNIGWESHLAYVANLPLKESYSLLFFDDEVQKILKKVTNPSLNEIFKPRPTGVKLKPPVYKLLTNEELEEEQKKAEAKAEYFLQIPPVVSISKKEPIILDFDTSLDGYDKHHSKHVFTDISYNETDHSRTIVVREPNGVLRTASREERHRMNQIYNPMPGREIETPEMFKTDNLINVIKENNYEFILNRACIQFEPDEVLYHKVTRLTYEAINYRNHFSLLISTRHFGSLTFYLVSNKNMDNLLKFKIEQRRIKNAFLLVKLYHMINPDCKSAESSVGKTDMEILRNFIQNDANFPEALNRVLENYLRRKEREAELENEIKEAHGV